MPYELFDHIILYSYWEDPQQTFVYVNGVTTYQQSSQCPLHYMLMANLFKSRAPHIHIVSQSAIIQLFVWSANGNISARLVPRSIC